MLTTVHYLPIFTTLLSLVFAFQLFKHWRAHPSPHVGWWTVGVVCYGIGTFLESWTTLVGWQEWSFRSWYIAGALLGGAPLAQGTVYLQLSRPRANNLAAALAALIVIAAGAVLLSPIDTALIEPHRLTGKVLAWTWVRAFSPFINTYAFIALVGGAVRSAIRYKRRTEFRNRFIANLFIAVGGLLPGIGGSFTRFGYTEVLYVTELAGLAMIFAGYRYFGTNPSTEAPISAIETR